jgi:hypothetical protein
LIQNADDAGATEVNFLYDDKTYGTQSLITPKLDKFQGPALYCFNNAVFEKQDWDGIQNLMRSNKKEDPLKVGRFGIGFNSVYHITGNHPLIIWYGNIERNIQTEIYQYLKTIRGKIFFHIVPKFFSYSL